MIADFALIIGYHYLRGTIMSKSGFFYKIVFLVFMLVIFLFPINKSSYGLPLNFSKEAITSDKKDINKYLWISEQFLKKGRFKTSLAIAKKIINKETDNIEAHAIIAASYKGLNLSDKFKKEETVIKNLTSQLSILYIMLGNTYLGLKQYKLAEDMYKTAIKEDKNSIRARNTLADFYINQKKFQKAHNEYQILINNYQLSTEQFLVTNLKLCKVNFILKNYNQNISICKKLINLYPKFPIIYMYLAKAYLAKKNVNQAINCYRQVSELFPNYIEPYQSLALVYIDIMNDKQKALIYIKKAMLKFPKNIQNYDIIGWIYYKSKEYNKALRYFKIATKLEKNPLYLYHLGITYKKISEFVNAKKVFRQAINMPNLPKSSPLYRQLKSQLNKI